MRGGARAVDGLPPDVVEDDAAARRLRGDPAQRRVDGVEPPDDLLTADAGQTCAAATDPVRAALGRHASPVVVRHHTDSGCVFVTPDHEVELTITVRQLPFDAGSGEPTSIAGHRATATSDQTGYRLVVDAGEAIVDYRATFNSPRASDAPARARVSEVDKLAADLTSRYLG